MPYAPDVDSPPCFVDDQSWSFCSGECWALLAAHGPCPDALQVDGCQVYHMITFESEGLTGPEEKHLESIAMGNRDPEEAVK